MTLDKYGVGQDPYCYPGSGALKNHFDLRDEQDLSEVEHYLSNIAAQKLEFYEPPYGLDTLKQIHYRLFSDIYYWAGKIRTVKISKGTTQFCVPHRIEPEADKEFKKMAAQNWFQGHTRDMLVTEVAASYGTLNSIHPFREGNGRTQRILFEWIIINAGYGINWWKVDRDAWIQANIHSIYGDDTQLIQVFDNCIGLPIFP
ncbi:Fic family protein [Alcaligenaceae bacterium]|nr:Fic family protein [Alcaligenaceae bacterium]